MTNVKIPEFIDYPKPIIVSQEKRLFDKLFVYIIKRYNYEEGYNLYIGFRKNNILIRIADFDSNVIDLKNNEDQNVKEILKFTESLSRIMQLIRIQDASFYFEKNELKLIDVMISINKFVGPGMLIDLFGKILPIQKTIEIKMLDEEVINEYKGNIVKPSRYRHIIYNQIARPLYGILE